MTSEVRSRKGLKRHDSIHVEVTKPGTTISRIPRRSELVHKAEVHDSRMRLVASSDDNVPVTSKEQQSRQLLRRRHRRPRKGSETDTLSEVESGGSGTEAPRQDTQDTSDKSSQSQTLVVPTGYHARRSVPYNIQSMSSVETSSTSHDYTALPKTRVREPRRGSLTDTLSEATDSESTVAAVIPKAPPRPSLDTTGDSQELHSQESIEQLIPPPRLKKLRRKRRGGTDDNFQENDDASSAADQQSDATETVLHHELLTQGEEKVVVRVSSCDSLRFLDFCRCPAVRLHIVDSTTGEYKTSSWKEGQTIPPLETQSFNMKLHRSVRPIWEEDLVVEEPSSHIATKQSLLLFELFDFVKGNTVAWAFLRLVATNGATNLGKPLRLQLFKPPRSPKLTSPNAPKCYGWWSKGKYSQYKSTLYISVNSILTTTVERGVLSPKSQQKTVETASLAQNGGEKVEEDEVMWSRYPGQSCKLPNSMVEERDSGRDGVLCLAFSHEGRLLAVPTSNGIILYTVPSLRIYLTLDKQQGLIYDVAWSEDDEYLVSASADATVCLWYIKKRITYPLKVLAHPSYVYCCCWVTSDLFASGCSDGVVRIWSVSNRSGALNDCGEDSSTPIEFLAQHSTRVNSLASVCRPPAETQRSESTTEELPSQHILISADNIGIILVWYYNSYTRKFVLEQEVKVKDLKGQIISRVVIVAKKGESATRVIVQSRDSVVRLIDLPTSTVLQIYQGGYLVKSKVGGCQLCGCGRRVWSASEDSSLIAWDYATGERVATYSLPRPSNHSLPVLALHPQDHILAYTFHSTSDHPSLYLLHFDKEADGSSVGLVIQEAARRRGALQWSALDSPLYEVPPVRLQPPPRLKAPTPATPSSRLSPAPTPVPRTTRRFSGEGPKLILEPASKRVTSGKGEIKRINKEEGDESLTKSKKTEVVTNTTEDTNTALSRDSRLSDILGKMDLILIQAQPTTAVK